MRTALSLALILMVISEMVASTNGIGYFVLQSQRSFAIAEMWSGILLLGILGYVLNALFVVVERRVLRWHRGARASALELSMLTVSHLKKSYGAVEAIADVSFEVAAGEFVCVVGPSGCGKTTLLKCISGLLEPTSGTVVARGRGSSRWSSRSTRRSLFPWMTVRKNVGFPLKGDKARAGRRGAAARSGSRTPVTATRGSSPAACSSASRSPARWPTSRRCC